MSILSVDLASNRYRDIGVAVLGIRDGSVAIELVEASVYGLKGRPCVEDVTSWLTELSGAHKADVIFIDGPQGWKDPAKPLPGRRVYLDASSRALGHAWRPSRSSCSMP